MHAVGTTAPDRQQSGWHTIAKDLVMQVRTGLRWVCVENPPKV